MFQDFKCKKFKFINIWIWGSVLCSILNISNIWSRALYCMNFHVKRRYLVDMKKNVSSGIRWLTLQVGGGFELNSVHTHHQVQKYLVCKRNLLAKGIACK